MLGSAHAVLLGAAGRPRISSITLTAIDAWAADADSGGTIVSASGGTLPAIPVTVDPTPFVSGASGSKSGWSVQFQGSTLGTWTRLAGGDLQFTPSAVAGTDDAEYRVSDDGGASWSDWQTITIEVVARPSGNVYLIEDYSGTDGQKIQAAIDAADAAGGGVVTTISNRGTVLTITDVFRSGGGSWGLTWRRCHLLGLRIKQPNARDNEGAGVECSPTGNGVTTGWRPGFFDDLIRGGLLNGTSWNAGTRYEAVLCDFDGNATKMALHETFGDNPTPVSNPGTCYPGSRGGSDIFNLQQQSGIRLKGGTGGTPGDRRQGRFKRCKILRTCGDGLNNAGAMDIILEDCLHEDCFRGSPNMIGANSIMQIVRNVTRAGAANINGRVDQETEGLGTLDSTYTATDSSVGGLHDMTARSSTGTLPGSPGSVYIIEGCDIGPQLNLLARTATAATVTFRGTTANPRGKIRFHLQGGGQGGTHPACRLGGWLGQTPHNVHWLFEDQDFIAHGDQYIFNTATFTPASGDYFHIRLGETVNTGDDWQVTLVNCQAYWQNRPSGATARLFDSVKTLSTAHTVRLDGLTIGTGFLQDAVQLDGHRLEYRNVTHADFPGATIQDICPGAGQYVAI